jgi:hypothetical protein
MEIVDAFRKKWDEIVSVALQHREALEATGLDINYFLEPPKGLAQECKNEDVFSESVRGLMEFGGYILDKFLKDQSPENADQLLTWIINSPDSVNLYAKLEG